MPVSITRSWWTSRTVTSLRTQTSPLRAPGQRGQTSRSEPALWPVMMSKLLAATRTPRSPTTMASTVSISPAGPFQGHRGRHAQPRPRPGHGDRAPGPVLGCEAEAATSVSSPALKTRLSPTARSTPARCCGPTTATPRFCATGPARRPRRSPFRSGSCTSHHCPSCPRSWPVARRCSSTAPSPAMPGRRGRRRPAP